MYPWTVAAMKIESLTPALGARITEIDLTDAKLDQEALVNAFHEHQVLVFPKQRLDPESHVRFTHIFGETEPHPLKTRRSVDGYPDVLVLENRAGKRGARNDYWHSDISHAEKPPACSILHAIEVPHGKGDTMFCNMYNAWQGLSDGFKSVLVDLKAVHSGAPTMRRNNEEGGDALPIQSVPEPRAHPVARTHPATAKKALYVNPHFTLHFEGMTEAESKGMLDYLVEQATLPENVYRHRWQVGDVLMWDNRCTMHYAVRDYEENDRRYLHRTTAAGEVPF